ncbi:hypothetical protein GCM10027430_35620 [Lysobacter tyrosinilyticus]
MRLLLAIALLALPASTLACDCVTPKYPTKSDFLQSLDNAQAVFIGTVTDVAHTGSFDTVSFNVTDSFKGVTQGPVKASTQCTEGAGSCGFGFSPGQTYLVYAWPDGKGGLVVAHCSFTKEYKRRTREIRVLREGANNSFKPKPLRGSA